MVKKDFSFQHSNGDWSKTCKLSEFALVHSSPFYSCKFCKIFHRLLDWFHNGLHNFGISLHWRFWEIEIKLQFQWFSYFRGDLRWQLADNYVSASFSMARFWLREFRARASYKASDFLVKILHDSIAPYSK